MFGIGLGTTRIVLLVGKNAIKIGRVRPIRAVLRTLTFPFVSKGNRERFYKKYGKTFYKAIFRYIFFGFYANRLEYAYYVKHREDTRVVSTLKMFLHGFVVIQTRGTAVEPEDFKILNPFKNVPNEKYQEVYGHYQFCNVAGKILLADYGHIETYKFLYRTLIQSVHSTV